MKSARLSPACFLYNNRKFGVSASSFCARRARRRAYCCYATKRRRKGERRGREGAFTLFSSRQLRQFGVSASSFCARRTQRRAYCCYATKRRRKGERRRREEACTLFSSHEPPIIRSFCKLVLRPKDAEKSILLLRNKASSKRRKTKKRGSMHAFLLA